MLRNFSPLLIIIFLGLFIWYLFYSSMPQSVEAGNVPETEFSTLRAFEHVKKIGVEPHYVGSGAHSIVRNYIVNELQEMGLEVQTQEGYVLDNNGVLSLARNILARIPGTAAVSHWSLCHIMTVPDILHQGPVMPQAGWQQFLKE